MNIKRFQYDIRNNDYKRGILFIICFSFLIGIHAQNLFFEKIKGEDINPVTSIHGIAKDEIGYMWFGSWNGVYRYDGKIFDFYYHNPKNNTSIPNNRIRNIISDKKYGLWFLTFDLKYSKYSYSLNNFKVVDVENVPKEIVIKLNSNSNELTFENNVNGKRYFLSSHVFTELELDSGNTFQYMADINQPGSLLDDYITSFFIDEECIIWLGSRNGDIYKANTKRNPFELHYSIKTENKKTKRESIRAVLKVKNEIWLGTDQDLLIYNDKGLNSKHPFYNLNRKIDHIRTLFMDNRGGVWIGTVNSLEYYNPKTNKITTIISKTLYPSLGTWSVFSIKSSGKDIIWVGLYNAIARINLIDKSINFYNLSKEIDNHSVMDLLVVGDNELWLGTEGNGVVQLEFNELGQISKRLLVNTYQSGLNQLGNMVYALHQDRSGSIFVGTSEGLSKVRKERDTIYIDKVELILDKPNTYISAITEDERGNIWVAHKKGISMIEVISDKVFNYSIKDQVNSWTFLERAVSRDTINDLIYFGAKDGYVSFAPKDIKITANSSKLALKSLFVSNEKVLPLKKVMNKIILTKSLEQTKSIELNYQNRSFAIELALLNYNDSNGSEFEYILEGYEDNWNKSFRNKISYSKLKPGKYIFKARSIALNGIKPPTVKLKINLLSPWYATYFALAVYALIFFGIMYFVFKEILSRERLKNEIKMERSNAEKHEELNHEKLEFFTNVSHELKTPLSLISGPLEQLQNDKLNREDKEIYFSIVDRNVTHLTRLINQILDFRKSEKGKLKLHPSSWSFNKLVVECYHSFKFIAIKRDISFNIQKDSIPIYCYLDLEKAEQIIMNILSNAFKYTHNGGRVSLSVGLDSKKTFIKIKIKDNGLGIEEKSLKKIFKPFNNIGSRPFYGNSSGIGLSLTKNLIDVLKGSISIDSYPNKGTMVTIKLPYIIGQGEMIGGDQKESKTINYDNNKRSVKTETKNKPTILIVEDNPDVQTYLSKELNSQFYLIQEYDGKKGLESAISNIPDLIISDVMMPIMEGTDLCKKLKLNAATCHIPVVILTAKDADEHQIEGYNYGAEAYITKPFSVAVLKAQLKSVLENRILLQKRLAKIKPINKLQHESQDLDTTFLKEITNIIKEGIKETNFNTEKLSQVMSISQRQLYRKLKAVSGSTVHEFITRVRMDHAEHLLTNTNLNVSQIAYEVGFSEPSNFSRTFSKYYGCSPSKYLKDKKNIDT